MYYRSGKNLVENFQFPKVDKQHWVTYLLYLLVVVVIVLLVVYGVRKYRHHSSPVKEGFGYRFY